MNDQKTLDPAEFTDRLNDSFGTEPLHAPFADDVRRGRKRLRRRRVTASLATLAAVGVVGTGVATMQTPTSVRPAEVAPAAQPELTRAEIIAQCRTGENALFLDGTGQKDEDDAVRLLGERPTLMTSAVIDDRTHATLRSEDGRYWGSCQFRNAPEAGVKNALGVYPTAVDFPRRTVAGVQAYQPANEADPRFTGGPDARQPHFEVPCVSPLTDEERWAVDAKCPEFTMTWNDRRPAEVVAVKVVTPDGTALNVRGLYQRCPHLGREAVRGLQVMARRHPIRVRAVAEPVAPRLFGDTGQLRVGVEADVPRIVIGAQDRLRGAVLCVGLRLSRGYRRNAEGDGPPSHRASGRDDFYGACLRARLRAGARAGCQHLDLAGRSRFAAAGYLEDEGQCFPHVEREQCPARDRCGGTAGDGPEHSLALRAGRGSV